MTTETDSTTVEIAFAVEVPDQDRLIAELDALGFDAFLQEDRELKAYVTASRWTPSLSGEVQSVLDRLGLVDEPRISFIEPQNWNLRWESTVEPIVVGPFIVTPSWKRTPEREKGLIALEIDPKMSFGTGYHATTRLMLRMLPSAVGNGDSVLDAGTGTGILAIAAARLGASHVVGIDNDPWSERNARENCERNGVAAVVRIELGDVNDPAIETFDVVLANIQLDVIVRALPALKDRMAAGGRLVVSGILITQESAFRKEAEAYALRVVRTESEDEWWAALLTSA